MSGAIEFLDPRVNANAYSDRRRRLLDRKFVINPKPGNLPGVPVLSDALGAAELGLDGPGHGRLNIRYLKQRLIPHGHKASRCPPCVCSSLECPSCRSASSGSRRRRRAASRPAACRYQMRIRMQPHRRGARARDSETVGVGTTTRFDATASRSSWWGNSSGDINIAAGRS